jgi:hypothetical protein
MALPLLYASADIIAINQSPAVVPPPHGAAGCELPIDRVVHCSIIDGSRHQWLSHRTAYEAVFSCRRAPLEPEPKPGREHPNNFLPKIAKD